MRGQGVSALLYRTLFKAGQRSLDSGHFADCSGQHRQRSDFGQPPYVSFYQVRFFPVRRCLWGYSYRGSSCHRVWHGLLPVLQRRTSLTSGRDDTHAAKVCRRLEAAAVVADCLTPAVCCAGKSVADVSIAAALGQLELHVPLVAAVAHAAGPDEQFLVARPAAEPLGAPRLGAAAELRHPARQLMACTKRSTDH